MGGEGGDLIGGANLHRLAQTLGILAALQAAGQLQFIADGSCRSFGGVPPP